MALINRFSNDYDSTQGIAGGLGSIAQAMRQIPAIKAQAAMRGAQTDRYRAMTQEALSRAGLLDAQKDDVQGKVDAAQEAAAVFSDPTAISKDSMGNVIISAPAVQRLLAANQKLAKGSADSGEGLKNILSGANAVPQAEQNRQSKESIAAASDASKEKIANDKGFNLNPGQSHYQNTDAPVVNEDSGDPDGSGLVARLVAQAPQLPAKDLAPYTTQTVRDERNPAYNPATGATNVPPVIKMTNTTTRGTSPAPTAQPKAQKPTRAQAADLVQKLGRDGAIKQLQAQGFDTSGYAD